MKNYKLYSNFPCLLKIKEEEILLEDNKFLNISLEDEDIIKVFPLNIRKDCYTISYLKRVKDFERQDFKDFSLIEIKENLISKNSVELDSNTYNNIKFKLYDFPHIFLAQDETNIYKYHFKDKFDDFMLKNNYLLAKNEDKMIFCMFHKKSKHFSYLKATNIEVKDDRVIITDITNDIAKHSEKTTYKYDSDGIKEIDRELFYINNEPKIAFNEDVLPIAFLEAVKIQDYSLARNYLSMSLKTRLTNEHLKAFFEDIKTIIPIEDKVAVINNNNETTIYTFSFSENKINNITSLD